MKRELGILSCAAFCAACDPSLPTPGSKADPPPLLVELTPAADTEAIHPVTHMRVVGAADTAGVVLVKGEVGPRQLDQIADGEPSKALAERVVPSTIWLEEVDVVVAPHVALAAGTRFDLVVASRETIFSFVVDASPSPPLTRLWPPAEEPVPTAEAVFCAPAEVPEIEARAALLPAGPTGVFRRGSPSGAAARCVRFVPDASVEGACLPPAAIGEGLSLEPGPILVGGTTDVAGVDCEQGEAAFGPGCATVEDDRVTLRPPDASVLWVVSGAGLDEVLVTKGGSPAVIKGLTPASALTLRVETLDGSGVWSSRDVAITTLPPRPRLILNEVYANPVGPEPDQEWIEIVNDGTASGDLASCTFEDIGGETPLPSAWLGPGGFAVVVNQSFDEQAEYDVQLAPSASVVRVPKLGKNGLSNSGEPLKLICNDGTVISRFPPAPKPKQGMSVSRVAPDAPDGSETSFIVAETPTPGSTNVSGG